MSMWNMGGGVEFLGAASEEDGREFLRRHGAAAEEDAANDGDRADRKEDDGDDQAKKLKDAVGDRSNRREVDVIAVAPASNHPHDRPGKDHRAWGHKHARRFKPPIPRKSRFGHGQTIRSSWGRGGSGTSVRGRTFLLVGHFGFQLSPFSNLADGVPVGQTARKNGQAATQTPTWATRKRAPLRHRAPWKRRGPAARRPLVYAKARAWSRDFAF